MYEQCARPGLKRVQVKSVKALRCLHDPFILGSKWPFHRPLPPIAATSRSPIGGPMDAHLSREGDTEDVNALGLSQSTCPGASRASPATCHARRTSSRQTLWWCCVRAAAAPPLSLDSSSPLAYMPIIIALYSNHIAYTALYSLHSRSWEVTNGSILKPIALEN